MTTSLPLIRVACAMAALAFSATASAGVDISTSLSGLRYRVIDLDPNDGITAAVTFTGGSPQFYANNARFDLWGTTGRITPEPDRMFFAEPTSYAGAGQAQGQGDVTGYNMSASVQTSQLLNAEVLAQNNEALHQPYGSPIALHNSNIGAESPLGDGTIRWALTPNTALVVEGQVDVQLHMDLNGIDRSLLQPYVDSQDQRFSVLAYASTYVDLSMKNPDLSLPWTVASAQADTAHSAVWTSKADPTASQLQTNDVTSKPFALTLQNTTTDQATGTMSFNSSLFAGSEISGFIPPFSPTVPEPGTWMLMGLGLLGLGTLTRARAHQHRVFAPRE